MIYLILLIPKSLGFPLEKTISLELLRFDENQKREELLFGRFKNNFDF